MRQNKQILLASLQTNAQRAPSKHGQMIVDRTCLQEDGLVLMVAPTWCDREAMTGKLGAWC